jgi:hypothetical protein
MSSLNIRSKSIVASTLMALGLWMGSVIPLVSLAEEEYVPPDRGSPGRLVGGGTHYTPPDRGIPGRREGGGTRGGCVALQPLTALMPNNSYGETISDYPSFYFFIPDVSAEAIEFTLLNEAGDEVYKTEFQVTGESGIVAIHLPETAGLTPLAVGENYEWIFSLICDRTDRSGDLLVSGWLQRIEAPDLVAEISALPPREQALRFAEAGIWYEALDTLVTLRLESPTDPAIAADWTSLFESVDLGHLAGVDFLPMPTPEVN